MRRKYRTPMATMDDRSIIVRFAHVPESKFARGGLVRHADRVRAAGRSGDDILVHMNRVEFDALKKQWGEPNINPDTGLPEYSWGDLWGGITNYFTSGDTGSTVGNVLMDAALGAGAAKLTGNNVGQGAIVGGLTGAASSGVGNSIGNWLGLEGGTAGLVGNAILGAGGAAAMGKDPAKGALIGGGLTYAAQKLPSSTTGGALNWLTGTAKGAGPSSVLAPSSGGATPAGTAPSAPAGTPSTSTAPAPSGGIFKAFNNLPADKKLAAALLLLQSLHKYNDPVGNTAAAQAAGVQDPNFSKHLTPTAWNRTRNIVDPASYFTYGQTGSANPGETQFYSGQTSFHARGGLVKGYADGGSVSDDYLKNLFPAGGSSVNPSLFGGSVGSATANPYASYRDALNPAMKVSTPTMSVAPTGSGGPAGGPAGGTGAGGTGAGGTTGGPQQQGGGALQQVTDTLGKIKDAQKIYNYFQDPTSLASINKGASAWADKQIKDNQKGIDQQNQQIQNQIDQNMANYAAGTGALSAIAPTLASSTALPTGVVTVEELGAGIAPTFAGLEAGASGIGTAAAASMPELSGSALAASQGMDPAIAAQINADMAAQGGSTAASTGSGAASGIGALGTAALMALPAALFSANMNNSVKHYNPQEIFDFSSNLLKQAAASPQYALANMRDINGRAFTNPADAQKWAQLKLDALNKMGAQNYANLHSQYLNKSSGIMPGDSPGSAFWNDPLTGVAGGVFGGINGIPGASGTGYSDQYSRYDSTPTAAAAAWALGDSSQSGALSRVYDPFTSANDYFGSYNRTGAGSDIQAKRLMASNPDVIKAIQQAIADGSYKNMGVTTMTNMRPDQFKSGNTFDASGALAQAAKLFQMYSAAHPTG